MHMRNNHAAARQTSTWAAPKASDDARRVHENCAFQASGDVQACVFAQSMHLRSRTSSGLLPELRLRAREHENCAFQNLRRNKACVFAQIMQLSLRSSWAAPRAPDDARE